MFVLTKRTAPSDKGNVMHSIHGNTIHVAAARAWFRATRTTDVIEIPDGVIGMSSEDLGTSFRDGNGLSDFISDRRIESWREQELREDLERAALKRDAT